MKERLMPVAVLLLACLCPHALACSCSGWSVTPGQYDVLICARTWDLEPLSCSTGLLDEFYAAQAELPCGRTGVDFKPDLCRCEDKSIATGVGCRCPKTGTVSGIKAGQKPVWLGVQVTRMWKARKMWTKGDPVEALCYSDWYNEPEDSQWTCPSYSLKPC